MRAIFLSLILFASGPALAATEAEFNSAISQTASRVLTARILTDLCDTRDPGGASARRDALSSWLHRHDVAKYDALMAELVRRNAISEAEIATNNEKAREQIGAALNEDDSDCANLAGFLADEKYEIRSLIRDLNRYARDLDIRISEDATATKTDKVEITGLAQFSVLAEAEMSKIGSREGAQRDRHLREAREKHLETYLAQHAGVAGVGRVIKNDEIREWRGDKQSRFSFRCRNFKDSGHEARMKASIGQDMVVLGTLLTVSDTIDASVVLTKCATFPLSEIGETMPVFDDASGLVLRPLEFDEAYAGPNAGIAKDDVDRVLYLAKFENRMDGFGNGYTHREEDFYVLLNDGSAYQHQWSFPFTDLNVTLSKSREPERWMTWSKSWTGAITLTKDGSEIDLSEAQEIKPIAAGTRLERSYYYLNVGSGGFRRDRSYVFQSDGKVTHSRGGFVAGNFATSYMIVTNNRDDSAISSYRFDDYALVLSHPDGEERHFFAILADADPQDPEDIIVGGNIYWTKKKD
jgi:hypothetical protein